MSKTALVTGGSHRIGKAICRGLAQAGFAVGVHYNTSNDAADELVTELRNAGHTAEAIKANLASGAETRTLLPTAIDALGPISLLINNASLFEDDDLDSISDELWDKHFNVHTKAPTLLAGAMAEQDLDEALIVNIIDQRVRKLTPNFTSYTLSKAALWTATKTMAQALAPKIRVNAIGPGPTLPSWRQTQEDFEAQVDTLILKRAPDLSEFVETILYFERAKSVTGQMIALDGGQHLGWETPDQLVKE